jgi:hypothetical protein
MRKFIIFAASFAALLALTATAAIAAPGATTHTVTLNAATDGVVDLPALNSQFTKIVSVTDGTTSRVDGGDWPNTTVAGKDGIHSVQVAYKDPRVLRPPEVQGRW